MSFAFTRLPTEIQLLVLHRVVSLSDRLNFRLVSTWTNTLVLEPCFWSVLSHRLRPHNTILCNRHPLGGAGLSTRGHHQTLAAALLQPQSDAHFQLSAPLVPSSASSSSALSHDNGLFPSWTIGANLSSTTIALSSNSTEALSSYSLASLSSTPASSTSAAIPFSTRTQEASFLSFVSLLTSKPGCVEAVQELLIEGWESKPFLDQLLLLLTQHSFDHLTKLLVRTNALVRFPSLSSLNGPLMEDSPSTLAPTCSQLTVLDLKNCQQLVDISGFHPWMPHLEEINLDGCTQLVHIVPPKIMWGTTCGVSGQRQQQQQQQQQQQSLPYMGQSLRSLRKLNLTHTKIDDRELIRLLEQSPQLHELRLDQCYNLTSESISAIGWGQSQWKSHQTLPPAPEQQLGPAAGLQLQLHTAVANPGALEDQSSSTDHSGPRSSSNSLLAVLSLNNCYDLTDESIRTLAGCRHLDRLLIRGLRRVQEDTLEWLHSQGVPLRKALSPLGMWRHWHNEVVA